MALKKSKACTAAIRAEQRLSLKMRSEKKPANMRRALARLNSLRMTIDTKCPVPGLRGTRRRR